MDLIIFFTSNSRIFIQFYMLLRENLGHPKNLKDKNVIIQITLHK